MLIFVSKKNTCFKVYEIFVAFIKNNRNKLYLLCERTVTVLSKGN